jgi:hypothetical protein
VPSNCGIPSTASRLITVAISSTTKENKIKSSSRIFFENASLIVFFTIAQKIIIV